MRILLTTRGSAGHLMPLAPFAHAALHAGHEVLVAARAGLGLPPDPAGDRLRDTPFLTMIPEPLEDPAAPAPRVIHRFRHAVSDDAPPLGDWWPGNDDPLVCMSFGSVTAGAHLPYFPALYRAAIDALAPLSSPERRSRPARRAPAVSRARP